jgi:hypothetical protein
MNNNDTSWNDSDSDCEFNEAHMIENVNKSVDAKKNIPNIVNYDLSFLSETFDIDLDIKLNEIELLNKSLHAIKLLKYEIILSNKKNNLQTISSEYMISNTFDKILLWLLKALEHLNTIKNNININININKNINIKNNKNLKLKNKLKITRNSYKFCEFGKKCKFILNNKICFSHHFVYDLVLSDICSVIKHLEQNKKTDYKIIDIIKSIDTIQYVLNHMYDELMN